MGAAVLVIRHCVETDWHDVVGLGNQFKKYLGLYPAHAILMAIRDARVLGAFEDDRLVGYVLFDLPYSDIRLVHLCVSRLSQGSGIARKLVDEIHRQHGDRLGIRLKCRRDYEAHQIWPKLGFQAQSLPTGRGKDRAEMTAWWRSFGHADLFSAAREDDIRLQAVLDTNVVLDLALDREPRTKEYLYAPTLTEDVTFCLTRSVTNELSETLDPTERRYVMDSLGKYESLISELVVCDELVNELMSGIAEDEVRRDPSLASDTRVLAETIVSGASVMITNDDNAARILRAQAKRHGVDVLHPSQLIVKVEELKGTRRSSPDRIQNTSITITQALAGGDRELDHLISSHRGESRAAFTQLIRSQADTNMRTVHAAESRLADGLLATIVSGDCLEIPILRVRRSPLGPTLMKQILFQLRHEALAAGVRRAVITDPAPGGGEVADAILREEGFLLLDQRWTAEVVDAQLRTDDMWAGNYEPWNLRPWIESGMSSTQDLARLEHELWPLKIVDAPLNCYVVPIKQRYASELLGYDTPLLARPDGLGISRRHVYYKSPNFFPASPGRVLWYVSGKSGGAIVASSQLISTHRGSPRSLHSRFRQYGVWTLHDVEERARKTGSAVALRFGDTEIFRNDVRLSEAKRIVQKYGRNLGTVQTVRQIGPEAFQEIYGRGMNR